MNVLRRLPLQCRQMSNFVKIVEVGPRDGLQNEPKVVDTDVKVEFVNKLTDAGLENIEVTSFVSPKWIPQMADNVAVFEKIRKKPQVNYHVLVPNVQGLEKAISVGARTIAGFASASETFARRNVNCSRAEIIERLRPVSERARKEGLKVRGYVSCIVGCPYEGKIPARNVLSTVENLLQLGCYEISLGDTIGVGTPGEIQALLEQILAIVEPHRIAVHFHDTYGQSLANTFAALELGIRTVDASVSGLGGCPYARGASGNLATEDLVYMLHGSGFQTNVHLPLLIKAGQFICKVLDKPTESKVSRTLGAKL